MAFPNISDILATTIESRTRKIADNVTKKGDKTESKNTTYYRGRVKEWTATNGSKIIVTRGQYNTGLAITRSLRKSEIAQMWLTDSRRELSIFSELEGGDPDECTWVHW